MELRYKVHLSDRCPLVNLEDIFNYLDEAECHVINTALEFTRTKSVVEGPTLLLGDMTYFDIQYVIDSANDMIETILKRKGDLYADFKRVFDRYFNILDPESCSRFICVKGNYDEMQGGNMDTIWNLEEGLESDWLSQIPSELIPERKWRSKENKIPVPKSK